MLFLMSLLFFVTHAAGVLRGETLDAVHEAALSSLERITGAAWDRWRLRRLAQGWLIWTRYCWCLDVKHLSAQHYGERIALEAAHASNVTSLQQQHASQLDTVQSGCAEEVGRLAAMHSDEVSRMQNHLADKLNQLQADHSASIEDLVEAHAASEEALQLEMERERTALSASHVKCLFTLLQRSALRRSFHWWVRVTAEARASEADAVSKTLVVASRTAAASFLLRLWQKHTLVYVRGFAFRHWVLVVEQRRKAQRLLASVFGLTFGAAGSRRRRFWLISGFRRWRWAASVRTLELDSGLSKVFGVLHASLRRRVATRFVRWRLHVLSTKQTKLIMASVSLASRNRREQYLEALTRVGANHTERFELLRCFAAWRCVGHERQVAELAAKIDSNRAKFQRLQKKVNKTPLYLQNGSGSGSSSGSNAGGAARARRGGHGHSRFCKICQRRCLKHKHAPDPAELTFGL